MTLINPITTMTLLNIEGRRLLISNIRNLLEIIISIIYFGNPSRMYMRGLLDLANEAASEILLNESHTHIYPRVKFSNDLINISNRFNALQENEEKYILDSLNRINKIEAEVDCNKTTCNKIPTTTTKPPPPTKPSGIP